MSGTERQVTIADLIRAHQDRTGDSYNDIARRGGLSKAKVGQCAVPTNRYLVRKETVAKLAKGLELPRATVERAAVATAGYEGTPQVQMSNRVRSIVERLGSMTPAQVSLVADLVEVVAQHAPRRTPKKKIE